MKDSTEYHFVPYENKHKKEVIALINSSFDLERDHEWWDWYYKDRHDLKPIQIIVNSNSSIVSQRSFVPIRFIKDNEITIGVQTTDSSTHPNHRRKGLFSKTAKMAMEVSRERGYSFSFGFAGPMSHPGYIKLGWKHKYIIPRFMKINNVSFLKKMILNKNIKKDNEEIVIDVPKTPLKNKILSSFPENIFINKSSKYWSVYKDSNYLNWRYSESPRDYIILGSYDQSGEIDGYVVIRTVMKKGLVTGCILDLEIKGNDKTITNSLLNDVMDIFKFNKCDITIFWNKALSKRYLYSKGFFYSKKIGTNFDIFALGNDKRFEEEAFKLSLGDTDSY